MKLTSNTSDHRPSSYDYNCKFWFSDDINIWMGAKKVEKQKYNAKRHAAKKRNEKKDFKTKFG